MTEERLDLLDRRLLVVMGKGGVGKSVIAAALARIAVQRGKKVLLVQINTKDKIADYLGCAPASEDIRELMPNLFGVNIRPAAAMKEYVLLQVRLEFIYRLVFENRAVRYFLRAVPALNDLVVLGKVYYHVNQEVLGRPLYDLVIVDAPPTGHGMFLLDLPRVMLRAVKSGPIHREATGMLQMLQDKARTAICLVSLPEEMPAAETLEMYTTLRTDYDMPLGALFINAVFPALLAPGDGPALARLSARVAADPDLVSLLALARAAMARAGMAQHYVDLLLAQVPLPAVRIPYLFSDAFGPAETARVSALIERHLGGGHGP